MISAQVAKAIANERRLKILNWLKNPKAHFPPQYDGDLVDDGVCGLHIAEKLGISPPTASEHLRVLSQAGLIRGKRIKQWTFYKRDEKRIREVKRAFQSGLWAAAGSKGADRITARSRSWWGQPGRPERWGEAWPAR